MQKIKIFPSQVLDVILTETKEYKTILFIVEDVLEEANKKSVLHSIEIHFNKIGLLDLVRIQNASKSVVGLGCDVLIAPASLLLDNHYTTRLNSMINGTIFEITGA